MRNEEGVTLVELVVVVMILLFVLLAVYRSYTVVYGRYKRRVKIAESNTEKLISFEVLRRDVEMAGYGLPAGDNNTLGITYRETNSTMPCDDEPNGEPRALCINNDAGPNGSDLLVVKSAVARLRDGSAGKTAVIYYGNSTWVAKEVEGAEFTDADHFIILEGMSRQLKKVGTEWYLSLSAGETLSSYVRGSVFNSGFEGNSDTKTIYVVYGISTQDGPYRTPFNRADYFLSDPDERPERCSSRTYTLYRAEVNHVTGSREAVPFMECVLDFQAAFGFDTDNNTTVDTWVDDISGYTASYIRNHLKQVELYVVYQEGQKEEKEVFPSNTIQLKTPDGDVLKTIDLSGCPDCRHYRWRVVEIAVDAINLNNQER